MKMLEKIPMNTNEMIFSYILPLSIITSMRKAFVVKYFNGVKQRLSDPELLLTIIMAGSIWAFSSEGVTRTVVSNIRE